ncbi:MAG: heme exporter protein CcmD [Caulobacteraceae bacterium]
MIDLAAFGGKYAAFVWPAYGISALVFAWMIIDTLAGAHRHRRDAERLERNGEP